MGWGTPCPDLRWGTPIQTLDWVPPSPIQTPGTLPPPIQTWDDGVPPLPIEVWTDKHTENSTFPILRMRAVNIPQMRQKKKTRLFRYRESFKEFLRQLCILLYFENLQHLNNVLDNDNACT